MRGNGSQTQARWWCGDHFRPMPPACGKLSWNASRQPDGAAQAAIHPGEYCRMNPGPIEEWIFYDHPSGRNRIYAAMRWKTENLQLFSAQAQK